MMLKCLFGVFVVGEMLDWEVLIGGYLLQVCFVISFCVVGGIVKYFKDVKVGDMCL